MRRRRRDSGFALLLVFLMASVIAITLYMQLPREAFESQRQKEQLLIERGEQYKLAIRRFIQANPNRWPGSMDELESFNNRRFLRHRYKDPMTGKDEWRLIHIQNGVLTDSKLNKNKTDQTKNSNPNTFIQEMAGLAGTPNGPGGSKNVAMRTRPSDANAGDLPGMSSAPPPDPNNPNPPLPPLPGAAGTGTNPINGQPAAPMPGQPGYPGGSAYPVSVGVVQPGMPSPTGVPGTQPAAGSQPSSSGGFIGVQPGLGSTSTTSASPTPGQPGYPGQQPYPGQVPYPGAPGMPVNSQTGGVSPYPVTPGAGGPPNQAVNMINNILTQPRPGGMPGQFGQGFGQTVQTGQPGQPGQPGQTTSGFGATPQAGGLGSPVGSPIGGGSGGQTIGGGIAGVASNDDEDSIMEYSDQTNYSLWEFVFDPTKWHAPPNPNVGGIGTPVSSVGSSIGQPAGTNTGITAGQNTGISGGSPPGGTPGGQTPGGTPGQQGTGGMPASGASSFGGGGLPDIRPGRR